MIPVGSSVMGTTVGLIFEMFALRMTLPSSVVSQRFAPSKWVIPPTVSSTSPSTTTSRLDPEMNVMPDGSGLGGDHCAASIVSTSEDSKSLAATKDTNAAGAELRESSRIRPVRSVDTVGPGGRPPSVVTVTPPPSATYRLVAPGSSVWSTLGATTMPCGLARSAPERSKEPTRAPAVGELVQRQASAEIEIAARRVEG